MKVKTSLMTREGVTQVLYKPRDRSCTMTEQTFGRRNCLLSASLGVIIDQTNLRGTPC